MSGKPDNDWGECSICGVCSHVGHAWNCPRNPDYGKCPDKLTVEAPEPEAWLKSQGMYFGHGEWHYSNGAQVDAGLPGILAHYRDAILATPKAIGDVEEVARKIAGPVLILARGMTYEDFYEHVKAILSPLFTPAGPCSECATLRKELDDSRKNHIDANERNMRAEAHALELERQCDLEVKTRDEFWVKLRDAEANGTVFSYRSNYRQLYTLKEMLEKAIEGQRKTTREGHKYCWTCGWQNGKHQNELNHPPCAAGEMERILAALAPTPEVAPKEGKP